MIKLYGNPPTDLGLVGKGINCDEMMYYLYLPIKLPGMWGEDIESRLEKFEPLIDKVFDDHIANKWSWHDKYVYLTVKTLRVSKGCIGQRPGWHSDGFMTDDINYIWYTDVPTVFWEPNVRIGLPQDHQQSMDLMSLWIERHEHKTYPCKHLLRLDETVIHRADVDTNFTGVRTFVKISVSDKPYALKGNSINPKLSLGVEYKERSEQRNCPISGGN